jgi:uncharacterized protein
MFTIRPDRHHPAILAAALLILLACTPQTAVPRLKDRVTDLAQVFSTEQRTRLIKELADFERETSHQMAVLTVPTLSGERIEDFSLRVANDWGLGQSGKDNGILVTLALKERQVRIELGKGLESDIPQETLDRIIRDDMVPAFRQGDYADGLEKGVRRLREVAPRSAVAPVSDLKPACPARVAKMRPLNDPSPPNSFTVYHL